MVTCLSNLEEHQQQPSFNHKDIDTKVILDQLEPVGPLSISVGFRYLGTEYTLVFLFPTGLHVYLPSSPGCSSAGGSQHHQQVLGDVVGVYTSGGLTTSLSTYIFHPASNGLIQRLHRTLMMASIRAKCSRRSQKAAIPQDCCLLAILQYR